MEKTLDELLEEAFEAVLQLQDKECKTAWLSTLSGVPPGIALGDGRQVPITADGLDSIREFGRRWRSNRRDIKASLRVAEAEKLAIAAFGRLLAKDGLENFEGSTPLKTVVRKLMERRLTDFAASTTHYMPVRIIDSDKTPFNIGPVKFMERIDWLDWVETTAGCSLEWVHTVRQFWNGKSSAPPSPRKSDASTIHDWTAYNVVDSFGRASWAAIIEVSGREYLQSRECAEIAVRVALDSLGLAVTITDARGLRGPGDSKHITLDRHFFQKKSADIGYSSRIDLPRFAVTPQKYLGFLAHTEELRNFAGAALQSFVDFEATHPKVGLHKRWVEAMFWYGQGLREPREFVGLVNAGVSLDILAKGSKANGITELCSALFDTPKDDVITVEGWTLRKLVKTIYDDGRSKFSHGGELALLEDLPVGRDAALDFARMSLTRYAEKLHLYNGSGEYSDFLKSIPSLGKP